MDTRIVFLSLPLFLTSSAAIYFLAKRGGAQMHPLLLNGSRLLLAGTALLTLSYFLGVKLPIDRAFWVGSFSIAALAIGIPQALLFVALKSKNISETTAAFIEGCVPAMTFVFLIALKPMGNLFETFLCVCAAMFGLAWFLGFNPFKTKGFFSKEVALILISAALTSLGLVLASTLMPSVKNTFQEKITQSIFRTGITTFLAGMGTLVFSLGIKAARWKKISGPAYLYIAALAFFGSGICWISLFLLIQEDVLIAASAIIAVPVVTALGNWWFFGQALNRKQIQGAFVINLALTFLIWLKLGTPS